MALFHVLVVIIAAVLVLLILYLYVYPNITTKGTTKKIASYRRERPLLVTDWGIVEVDERDNLGDGWNKVTILNNDGGKEVMRLHENEITNLNNMHNFCGSGRPIWILTSMKKKDQDMESLVKQVKEYEHEKDFYQNMAGLRNADMYGEVNKILEGAEKILKARAPKGRGMGGSEI